MNSEFLQNQIKFIKNYNDNNFNINNEFTSLSVDALDNVKTTKTLEYGVSTNDVNNVIYNNINILI